MPPGVIAMATIDPPRIPSDGRSWAPAVKSIFPRPGIARMQLSNVRAIVTGGVSGLGFAVAFDKAGDKKVIDSFVTKA